MDRPPSASAATFPEPTHALSPRASSWGITALLLMVVSVLGLSLLASDARAAAEALDESFRLAPLDSKALRTARSGATVLLAQGRIGGHVAPPLALPAVSPSVTASLLRREPSRYISARAYDLRRTARVSPVRDQGRFGTCWAFAALGSLESSLRPGLAADYSENNMADRSGFRLGFNGGGNSRMAAAYLTRWDGPVRESDDPYGRPLASPAGLPERVHVQEVLYLPARRGAADNDTLKWAIETYGAVAVSMQWDDYCFRRSTSSYYYSGVGLNHDVTCVGWDDAYPATRFAQRPPGDGAFLVRNSWGRGFGDGGYFWVSYHDTAFAAESAVFCGGEPVTRYSAVYGHDRLGWIGSGGFDETPGQAWFAARHTATARGSLAAVAFSTPVPDSEYQVYAGRSLDELGATPLAQGTLSPAGYHTVRLASALDLEPGEPFVVAVHLRTPGYAHPVPVEAPVQGYAAATARAGQSFVSVDGERWVDITTQVAHADVCLKAFAVGESARQDVPTVVLRNTRVRRGAVVRLRLRVAHAEMITASVRLRIVSRRGVTARRVTLRGVPTNTSYTWTLRRRLPEGRYRVVASASDRSGRRQLTPTQATLRIR